MTALLIGHRSSRTPQPRLTANRPVQFPPFGRVRRRSRACGRCSENPRRSITQAAHRCSRGWLPLLADLPCERAQAVAWRADGTADRPRKTGTPQMDYCSTCRRHLNGALVCPGCGAYAPDIAPPAAGRVTVWPATIQAPTDSAPAAHAIRDPSVADTWHDGPPRGQEEHHPDWDVAPYTAPSADGGDVPVVREGRAARRRQLARWKKNKRRAAVATAVALVGGGLTIAAMDGHSPDRARAATAPDQEHMGALEEQTPTHARPASTPPTPHPSLDTSEAGSPASGTPRRQPPATPPSTTPPIARPHATASPAPTTASTPQPQNTASSSDDSDHDPVGSAAGQPTAPATAESTDSGTSQTGSSDGSGSAPASTSPTQVCLLVLCLG
ncbi:SCO2400 family protein [Streptomyces justiciae]